MDRPHYHKSSLIVLQRWHLSAIFKDQEGEADRRTSETFDTNSKQQQPTVQNEGALWKPFAAGGLMKKKKK